MTRLRPIIPELPPWGSIDPRVLAEARVNGGMVTSIDPADLENNQAQYIKNMRVRFDKTLRRAGYSIFSPAKPNSEKVLKLVTVKDNLGNATTLRFTKGAIYKLSGGSWVALTGAGLSGSDSDRVNVVVIEGQFFSSNNGADEVQVLDVTGNTYADNGNAPKFKFITGFYERLVGAYIRGSSAIDISWSGQLAYDEFDAAVDISAGTDSLVESPSDLADHISGIFGITNYLVIPRERSIWVATKNPQAQKPFNFYNAAPGVGTNLPYTIAVWEQGLIFGDARTGSIWFYAVGSKPESIGRPNDKLFARQLSLVNPDEAFASYDSIENEYTIVLPYASGGVYPAWTYNFRTQAWSYDEYPNTVWSLQDFDYASGYITIDELVGTIDGLVGTIDSLSPPATLLPTRAFGLSNGDIITEAKAALTTDEDNSVAFNSEWVSKTIQTPTDDQAIGFLRLDIQFDVSTQIDLYYAIDGEVFGDEKSPVENAFISLNPIYGDGRTEVFTIPINVRCRAFKFKLKSASGAYKIVGYEVNSYAVGRSQR